LLTVNDVFGPSLGTYGDNANYVIYKQTGTDDYEVVNDDDNTEKVMLSASDTLEQGKSYWIITDQNRTVTIDKTLSGLSQTPTTLATAPGFNITDPDAAFTRIFDYQLFANGAVYRKKYMAGNPFPFAFDVSRIFMNNTANGVYYPLADANNSAYISPKIYTHDSPDLTGVNQPNGGYVVLDASTPGFVDKVRPMEGFFLIFPVNNSGTQNNFAFPLMTQYGN
jgi:hypothetical protein